jgi:ribosomal protein L40E
MTIIVVILILGSISLGLVLLRDLRRNRAASNDAVEQARAQICPHCGLASPASAVFCGHCGKHF